MYAILLDPALDLLGLPSLLVRPQAVPFDETGRLFHLHHSLGQHAMIHLKVYMPGTPDTI
jgi:hypothetical protein